MKTTLSICIPTFWRIPNYLEDNKIDKLKNLLKPKSESDNELHVQEVRKRGNEVKIGEDKYSRLSDLDTRKDLITK